jgi:hypothetical protein
MTRSANAIADDVFRAHVALLGDLQDLEDAVSPTSRADVGVVAAALAAAREHVKAHFRFEEEDGYMEALRRREPHLERAIHQLAEEHHELAGSLDALVAEARAAPRLDDGLRERIRAWTTSLRQHEARENALVQDAFNRDVGPED